MRRTGFISTTAVVAVLGLLLVAAPAHAIPGVPGPPPTRGAETNVVMTGTAEGQSVAGSLPVGGQVSDPSSAYPSAPPTGFAQADQGFAGIITAQAPDSSVTLKMFCIDILTSTYPGLGYENGSWEQAGMPNVGYVARLLNEYFPNTAEPVDAPNDNVRAAAVQAAIWYFTDYFVLAPGDPIRPYTQAIVDRIRVLPPLPAPTPPSLTVTPASTTSPVGAPAGPFTVATDAPGGATASATGGTMFRDAALTSPVQQGGSVLNGEELWVVPDTAAADQTVDLLVRGEALVPSGNVYIYDQNTPGVADAQRLILAETVEVITNATASATFVEVPLAALTVTKTIAGAAAGSQGPITVRVTCDNGLQRDLDIPSAATGSQSVTITELPAGTTCAVTEPRSGATEIVKATTSGLGSVVVPEGGAEVSVTNTYEHILAPTGGEPPIVATALSALLLVAGAAMIGLRRRAKTSPSGR